MKAMEKENVLGPNVLSSEPIESVVDDLTADLTETEQADEPTSTTDTESIVEDVVGEETQENAAEDGAALEEAPDPTNEIAEDAQQAIEFPNFMEVAERIPYRNQADVADIMRRLRDNLSSENLIDAIGEQATVYRLRNRQVPMLVMRLKNGSAVYVPISEIGSSYRHIEFLVGKVYKIAITNFVETGDLDQDQNPEYIVMGSIRQAEFVIGRELFREFTQAQNAEDTSFVDQTREGVITDVVDTVDLQMIFFKYRGMSLAMYANDYDYMSYTKPLHTIAKAGEPIRFKISNIRQGRFEDADSVQNDINNGRPTPRGIRYFVRTSSLDFRTNPVDKVRALEKSRAAFIARMVRYNPIKGILVEIAPGWWIKGILSNESPLKPTIDDGFANTPVTVRIEQLNYKNRTGKCRIISFPQGLADSRTHSFF